MIKCPICESKNIDMEIRIKIELQEQRVTTYAVIHCFECMDDSVCDNLLELFDSQQKRG